MLPLDAPCLHNSVRWSQRCQDGLRDLRARGLEESDARRVPKAGVAALFEQCVLGVGHVRVGIVFTASVTLEAVPA